MSKLGLVFSGGGGKGAYEIGVWKALREYGVEGNVQAVAGTQCHQVKRCSSITRSAG